jgi:type I restriction-modification system DNA methylase subunit
MHCSREPPGRPWPSTTPPNIRWWGLLRFPNDIGANFSAYLGGFLDNVKDILLNFSGGEKKGLSPIYETLLHKRLLFKVTQAFAEADRSLATVDNHGMGTIFEYLIRKFKEASKPSGKIRATKQADSVGAPPG